MSKHTHIARVHARERARTHTDTDACALKSQKRVLDPLEVKLLVIVGHQVGAGNPTLVL